VIAHRLIGVGSAVGFLGVLLAWLGLASVGDLGLVAFWAQVAWAAALVQHDDVIRELASPTAPFGLGLGASWPRIVHGLCAFFSLAVRLEPHIPSTFSHLTLHTFSRSRRSHVYPFLSFSGGSTVPCSSGGEPAVVL
jgi:hypothetical protein